LISLRKGLSPSSSWSIFDFAKISLDISKF